MTSKYKEQAKLQLSGNVMTILGCTVIMSIATFVISLVLGIIIGLVVSAFDDGAAAFVVGLFGNMTTSLITTLVSGCLTVGLMNIYLNLSQDEGIDFSMLFAHLGNFVGCGLLIFFMNLFIQLWSLLFVIPGLIAAFSYSMAVYVYIENPDMSPLEALKRSKQIMNGHKMDLLMLNLSFILWHLLGMVTCGLAYIYVMPYIAIAQANFYNDIKEEY